MGYARKIGRINAFNAELCGVYVGLGIAKQSCSSSVQTTNLAIRLRHHFSLLTLSLFFLQAQPIKFLLFWLALSLLVSPFALPSIISSNVCDGHGEDVNCPDEEASRKSSQRRSRQWRPKEVVAVGLVVFNSATRKRKESSGIKKCTTMVEEEKE